MLPYIIDFVLQRQPSCRRSRSPARAGPRRGSEHTDLASPRLPSPGGAETREFIERHASTLAGSGVGWADAQVILAAVKAGASLHSSDSAVLRVCRALDVVPA